MISEMLSQESDEVQVLFRLPASDIAAFDKVANARRMSRAALLRQCILEKIQNME